MQRRIFAIPLCIILCIAVFSFSVFALPPNDYNTSINCSFELSSGLVNYSFTLQSGNLNSWGIWSMNSDNYVSLASYSGSLSVSHDLYIAVLTSSLPHVYFEGLDDYYYPAGNIVESVNLTTALDIYTGGSTFTPNSPLATQSIESVTFCYFRDVPAGTSFQVNDINPYPPDGTSFINAYSSYAQSNVNFSHYLFGFFFATAKVTGDQIIDQFKNGEISFDEALDSLSTLKDELINSSTDYTQSLLNLSIYQTLLDELFFLSDDSFSTLLFSILPSLDSLVLQIRSGYPVTDVLDTLSNTNSEILNVVTTPDQASFYLEYYDFVLDRVKLEYQIYKDSQLQDVVPDEYLNLSDEYIAAEDEIFALFDREELEAQIAYETWFYALPSDETTLLKNFFNYLISNSPIKFFITVPMCLGLVSIILGSRLNIFRGDRPAERPSDEERYWKSTSDNYFNFKGG